VASLSKALFSRLPLNHSARLIAELPHYQVAFWPDGWELGRDGAVTVRDTHAMAEARRWYRLAGRHPAKEEARRIMSMHGIDVPRAVVEMTGLRFASEQVASVAVQLAAGEWIRQRRRRLLEQAADMLRLHAMAWTGSHHAPGLGAADIERILSRLLVLSAGEGLIPPARYRLRVHEDNGYGIPSHRCRVEVCLDSYQRRRVEDALKAGLVPWNRAVVRDGHCVPLIELEVRARQVAQP
jgi:hypothetical protein